MLEATSLKATPRRSAVTTMVSSAKAGPADTLPNTSPKAAHGRPHPQIDTPSSLNELRCPNALRPRSKQELTYRGRNLIGTLAKDLLRKM